MNKILELLENFFKESGIAGFFAEGGWKYLIMIAIACVLLFLAIKKQFEPYLLLPIAFGMLLVNIPGVKDQIFVKTLVEGTGVDGIPAEYKYSGLIGYLYYGVK